MLSQTMRVGSVLGLALTGKILDKSDGERAARTYPPALPRRGASFGAMRYYVTDRRFQHQGCRTDGDPRTAHIGALRCSRRER